MTVNTQLIASLGAIQRQLADTAATLVKMMELLTAIHQNIPPKHQWSDLGGVNGKVTNFHVYIL